MKFPRIGELRARLIFQEEVETINVRGGKDNVWTERFRMWGKVIPTSGMPHVYSDHLENGITHKLIIRHNSEVIRKQRIVYGDYYWTINTVITHDVANSRFMELLVTQQDDEV